MEMKVNTPLDQQMKELEKKIHDVNENQIKYKNEMWQLQAQKRELQKQECLRFVGTCWKRPLNEGFQYVCVLRVPEEQHTMTSTHFNENQLPALFIDESEPSLDAIYEDTFFRGYIPGEGHTPFKEVPAQEITLDEFREALARKYREIDNMVLLAGLSRPPMPKSEN